MPLAELGEVVLFYAMAGDGQPVLVIGGTGGDLRQAPGPFAWPGAERFSLLAYDHRDQGRSSSRRAEQPTMADFTSDALALVDHVGWDRFSVIGISFGGMVAQELALAAGERIGRLVLACTSSGGEGSRSYPLHELYALPAQERAARLVQLLDTRAAAQPGLADALAQYLADDRGLAAHEAPAPGLLRQLEARRHHDTSRRLSRLKVPALVAAGRFDGIAPVAASETLADAIPGARLEVFDGGHGFLVQDPTAWLAIADFLLTPLASAR
jgi:3-oxoadipate enol-lactonase